MRNIIIIFLLWGSVTCSYGQKTDTAVFLPVLTDSLQLEFSTQAEELVVQLGESIGIIVDNSENQQVRFDHKKIALGLFSTDSNIVEITSTKNQSLVTKRKIKKYLDNLYALSEKTYNKVSSRWFNIEVCRIREEDFIIEKYSDGTIKLDEDGNPSRVYFGTVTFCQEFKARSKYASSIELKSQFDIVNIDCKKAQIIIKKGMKNGRMQWIARLGDITIDDYDYFQKIKK